MEMWQNSYYEIALSIDIFSIRTLFFKYVTRSFQRTFGLIGVFSATKSGKSAPFFSAILFLIILGISPSSDNSDSLFIRILEVALLL